MKELTEIKKIEILRLFLEGYSYDEIATKSDVAKGSVVNVVTDFKNGRFPTFTDATDMVDVLRELSVELRKKGVGVSEALLGIAFFSRLSEIGLTPDKVWLWADMCREISPAEAPVEQFTAAALEVFRLTRETGESYDSVVAKWSKLRAESESLGQEVENLSLEKKELETTQAALTEKCHKLKEEKDGLDRDIEELSTRCEALKKETSQLEASRQLLNKEVTELDDKVMALRPEMEALEGLGFGKGELETLRVKLEEIASSQSLTPKVLTTKFFQDLVEYETVVSFQKRREELEGEVASLRSQKESLEHVMSRLRLPPEEVEEAVKSLVSLKKKGIALSIVASYCRVLSKSSLEPSELEREVTELGGLKKTIDTVTQAVKQLQAEAAQRTRVVDALRAEEATIKDTIKELTQWGQKVMKEAQGKALTTVKQATEKMAKDLRQWGDKRAELGVYLDDLKRARYFTRLPLSNEALDSYIEDISPLVVSQGLQIVLFWCVRKFNPKLRPPKWITRKYYSIGEYMDVELVDLIRWCLEAFAEEVKGNEGRA